jgi:hypothetical protein
MEELIEVVSGAIEQLRAVSALVNSGALTAGPDQLASLRGAVDALQVVADQAESPVTKP